jgi:hypothetical protein
LFAGGSAQVAAGHAQDAADNAQQVAAVAPDIATTPSAQAMHTPETLRNAGML